MAFMINTKNRSVATNKRNAYSPPIRSNKGTTSVFQNTQSAMNSIVHGTNNKGSRLTEMVPFETGNPKPGMVWTAVMPPAGMKWVFNTSGQRVAIPAMQPTVFVDKRYTGKTFDDPARNNPKLNNPVKKSRTLMF
jgi:hypothetical protein